MKLSFTTLGISSASPMPDRYQSAHVLRICGRLFLIDCGEGCQYLLKKHGISIPKLDAIFISHTHGDHVFGLFGLLNTMAMKRRTRDLDIYGPESLKPILDFYNSNFVDVEYFKIIFHTVNPEGKEIIYEDDDIVVSSFHLLHGVITNAYIFKEKKEGGRSFAYISDTANFEALTDMIQGVDMIYHEATFGEELSAKASRMFHSTACQAARVALEAGARKLILGHFSSVYSDPSVLLPQARKIFPETYIGSEGMEFEL